MNKQLTKLTEIAQKPERVIAGLMSGTSLDGLDIALCRISGHGSGTDIEVLEFETRAYSDALQKKLRSVQSEEQLPAFELTRLHSSLGYWYADTLTEVLKKWGCRPVEVDLIGSHGQTVYHAPDRNEGVLHSTLQIVDGDHIARRSGIITISDFRQKHTAAGGEGAPLAAIFDQALFQSDSENRLLLNLGGISNLTWLPAGGGEIITGDVGPANTLINEAMKKYFSRSYDEGGEVARSGKVHSELVRYILLEPYFRKAFPKTTGQEDFRLDYIEELMEGHSISLTPENLVASLTAVTSQSISRAVEELTDEEEFEVFVSGGGIHNRAIMDDLKVRLPRGKFRKLEDLGISPDSKEAAMMAFFANELVAGKGFAIPGLGPEKVQLGKISLPG